MINPWGYPVITLNHGGLVITPLTTIIWLTDYPEGDITWSTLIITPITTYSPVAGTAMVVGFTLHALKSSFDEWRCGGKTWDQLLITMGEATAQMVGQVCSGSAGGFLGASPFLMIGRREQRYNSFFLCFDSLLENLVISFDVLYYENMWCLPG